MVIAEIAPGLPFRQAGVIWMRGNQPMQPVDFSAREARPIGSAEPAGQPFTVFCTTTCASGHAQLDYPSQRLSRSQRSLDSIEDLLQRLERSR